MPAVQVEVEKCLCSSNWLNNRVLPNKTTAGSQYLVWLLSLLESVLATLK